MSLLTLIKPIIGKPDATEDVKINNALTAIEAWANGKISSSNLEATAGITEGQLATAVQALLNAKTSGLAIKESKVSMTAASGEFVLMTTSGTTVTLPAPTANRVIGVFAGEGATITVKAVAASIIGDFENSTHVTLRPQQHITLQAEGNNWLIIAGEPELESHYEALTSVAVNTSHIPSTRRPADVALSILAGELAELEVIVGGVMMSEPSTPAGVGFRIPVSFSTGPGQAWEVKAKKGTVFAIGYSFRTR